MAEVVVEIPKSLESDRARIENKLRHVVEHEAREKMMVKFFDELMKGAKQLSDEEIVEFAKKFKEAGSAELKREGLI